MRGVCLHVGSLMHWSGCRADEARKPVGKADRAENRRDRLPLPVKRFSNRENRLAPRLFCPEADFSIPQINKFPIQGPKNLPHTGFRASATIS
jgi:hypothetical protein